MRTGLLISIMVNLFFIYYHAANFASNKNPLWVMLSAFGTFVFIGFSAYCIMLECNKDC